MPSRYNEQQLVDAIRRGDHAAFAHLVVRTQSMLLAYSRRYMKCSMAAEDVVQDVYAQQWKHRDTLTVRGSLAAYLRRAVRNRALDILRRTNKFHQVSQHVSLPDPPSETDQALLSRELEAVVLDIVKDLPFRCRQAFLWCGVAEWSHARAAQAMGVHPSTVNGYLVEARKELLRQLRERYSELPTWLQTPEMVFHETKRTRRLGHAARHESVHIDMEVDLSQHEPTRPFSSIINIIMRDATQTCSSPTETSPSLESPRNPSDSNPPPENS